MKYNYGWILEKMVCRKSYGYVVKNLATGKKLQSAAVFDTCEEVRKSPKLHSDVVRKVLLDKQGKPKRIISGR